VSGKAAILREVARVAAAGSETKFLGRNFFRQNVRNSKCPKKNARNSKCPNKNARNSKCPIL
jgi:hypothetical protein